MYVVHMSGEKGGRAKPSGASRIGDPFGGISRSPLRRTRKEEELAGRRVPPRSDVLKRFPRIRTYVLMKDMYEQFRGVGCCSKFNAPGWGPPDVGLRLTD